MTPASYLFVVECLFIGLIAGFLVWHDGYEDDILKRAALGLLLCVPCYLIVAESVIAMIFGETASVMSVPPLVAWVGLGVLVFLSCHALKWWGYYKRGRNAWTVPTSARADWKSAQDRETRAVL